MAERQFHAPNTLRAGLNYFSMPSYNPHDPMDRPPFPIVIADPLFREVTANLNYGDLGLYLMVTAATTLTSFFIVRAGSWGHPVPPAERSEFLTIRGRSFRFFAVAFALFNAAWPASFSYQRLRGLKFNGLSWLTARPPVNRFRRRKADYSLWSRVF